jgi:hypothetical protein
MSQDFLVSRSYAAESTAKRVVDDTPVVLRITHIDACAVTSVTLTAATSIVLIDAKATTTVAFATYSTVGQVADVINGSSTWRCKVIDALRADTITSKVLTDGAIVASIVNGESVYSITQDTDALDNVNLRLTYDETVADSKPKGNHRVKLNKITYNWNVASAAANGIRVYKYNPATNIETQIWGATSVDGTGSTTNDTSHTFTSGLSGGDGNDLIVVINSGAITDNAVNFLQAEFTRE